MINIIAKIKDALKGNSDEIESILYKLELTKIRKVKDRFHFGRDDDSKGMANVVYIDTVGYRSFSRDEKGDIITLSASVKGISVGDAIKWLAKELGLSWEYKEPKDVVLPFGAWWQQLDKHKEKDLKPLKTYSEDIVKDYQKNGLSLYWVRDGISLQTQEHFSIGYDVMSSRNTIPWRNELGECIGINGRLDRENLEDWEYKYLPIIPFYKGDALYGLYENYKGIQEREVIVIAEAEKTVMKAYEMGYKNVCSIGCSNISSRQEKIIKSLAVDVIIAFDEGLDLGDVIKQGEKCKIQTPFWSNNVAVVDVDGLPSKSCIFDLGEDVVKDAFENRLIYI